MPGAVPERRIRRRNLLGQRQFRVIPSRFPPIEIFERLVAPEDLEVAYAIEGLSNDRLRASAGELYRVPKEDQVTGPNASVVMAAFTHIGRVSRFSDGSYGVYYAALDEDTAVAETVFHAERFLRETAEPPIELERRCYVGKILQPLDDLRGPAFTTLCDPDLASYPRAQAFAADRRAAGAWGLYYPSARRKPGQCVAAFRTRAVSLPVQGRHFRYRWDGTRIDRVITVSEVRDLR
jgi:hypothetical protein